MNLKFFSLLFLFTPTVLFSQTIIKGIAPTYQGSRIILSIYADFLSETYNDIAVDTVDMNGNFEFNVPIERTERAEIRCENTITTVFLSPNANLSLELEPKDRKMAQVMSYIEYLSPKFKDLSTENINTQIIVANNLLDSFLNENKIAFLQQRIKPKMPELYGAIEKRFGNSTDIYLKDYLFFSAKELELAGGINKLELITTLVKNGLDFRNDACVRLLSQLFTKEQTDVALAKYADDLKEAINKKAALAQLDSLLQLDQNLFLPKLRTFVLIQMLNEEFTNDEYSQESILYHLRELSIKEEDSDIQVIARNLLKKLSQLRVGSKAPFFNLPATSGQRVSLKDFEGKYVLIGFWASWSSASMAEITILESLYKRYHNDIAFVMISTDSSMSDIKRFATARKITTTLLWFDNDPDILNNYKIKALPNFFLVDPYGNFELSPAPFPSQQLERDLVGIYNRNHPRRPITYQWDETAEPDR